jgi:CBS domain-containing protein
MKVVDMMMGTPYYCRPDSNLGEATELMWRGNCGFLPVIASEGNLIGVLTDRDICIALGTRGRPSGEVAVRDVMSKKIFSCAPDDDVRTALRAMSEGRVRRLPVISKGGSLVGVISMDDVLLRAEAGGAGKAAGVSVDEIVNSFRAINTHLLPVVASKQAVA